MFFWRHKILTILIALGFCYFYFNPGKGFGLVRPEVIIYNRMPLAFLDFFVNASGKVSLIGDLKEPGVFSRWIEGGGSRANPLEGDNYIFVVGTGFGATPSFLFPDSCAKRLKERGIKIEQAPTPRAAQLYNAYRMQQRPVAALMRAK